MSQRTHVPTTGDDPPPPAKSRRAPKRANGQPAAPANAEMTAQPQLLTSLSPEEVARALRAVASELERDPALARRVADALRAPTPAIGPAVAVEPPQAPARVAPTRAFTPRIIEGASADLGTGIPDPFALRARLGDAEFARALDGLRLGSLRAIVREHHLDPTGALTKGGDADKLRAAILSATDTHAPRKRRP